MNIYKNINAIWHVGIKQVQNDIFKVLNAYFSLNFVFIWDLQILLHVEMRAFLVHWTMINKEE